LDPATQVYIQKKTLLLFKSVSNNSILKEVGLTLLFVYHNCSCTYSSNKMNVACPSWLLLLKNRMEPPSVFLCLGIWNQQRFKQWYGSILRKKKKFLARSYTFTIVPKRRKYQQCNPFADLRLQSIFIVAINKTTGPWRAIVLFLY
jgi:hypothetical protein